MSPILEITVRLQIVDEIHSFLYSCITKGTTDEFV
jgi:hypothetical protein